jgi:hypothetical protein
MKTKKFLFMTTSSVSKDENGNTKRKGKDVYFKNISPEQRAEEKKT